MKDVHLKLRVRNTEIIYFASIQQVRKARPETSAEGLRESEYR